MIGVPALCSTELFASIDGLAIVVHETHPEDNFETGIRLAYDLWISLASLNTDIQARVFLLLFTDWH